MILKAFLLQTCSLKIVSYIYIYIYLSCPFIQGVAAMKTVPMTLSCIAPHTTSIVGIPSAIVYMEVTVTENNRFLVSDAS